RTPGGARRRGLHDDAAGVLGLLREGTQELGGRGGAGRREARLNLMSPRRPTLLLNGKPPQAALEARLAESYTLHRLHEQADPAAFLAAHGAEIDGIVAPAPMGASAELIDALPKLRVIANFGVGFDKVDQAAAVRRGVKVSNTPDVLNDCVAD